MGAHHSPLARLQSRVRCTSDQKCSLRMSISNTNNSNMLVVQLMSAEGGGAWSQYRSTDSQKLDSRSSGPNDCNRAFSAVCMILSFQSSWAPVLAHNTTPDPNSSPLKLLPELHLRAAIMCGLLAHEVTCNLAAHSALAGPFKPTT